MPSAAGGCVDRVARTRRKATAGMLALSLFEPVRYIRYVPPRSHATPVPRIVARLGTGGRRGWTLGKLGPGWRTVRTQRVIEATDTVPIRRRTPPPPLRDRLAMTRLAPRVISQNHLLASNFRMAIGSVARPGQGLRGQMGRNRARRESAHLLVLALDAPSFGFSEAWRQQGCRIVAEL